MYLCCSASATPSSWSRLLFTTLSSMPRTPLLTKRTRQSSSNGSLSSSFGIWLLSSNKAALLRARFWGYFLFQPNVVAMFVYHKAVLSGQLFPPNDNACDVRKFKNSLNMESAMHRTIDGPLSRKCIWNTPVFDPSIWPVIKKTVKWKKRHRKSSDGADRRIFLGLKFAIPGFLGVGKFSTQIFFGVVWFK